MVSPIAREGRDLLALCLSSWGLGPSAMLTRSFATCLPGLDPCGLHGKLPVLFAQAAVRWRWGSPSVPFEPSSALWPPLLYSVFGLRDMALGAVALSIAPFQISTSGSLLGLADTHRGYHWVGSANCIPSLQHHLYKNEKEPAAGAGENILKESPPQAPKMTF